MKHLALTTFCIAAALLCACSKEVAETPSAPSVGKKLVPISFSALSTKTAVSDAGAVTWEAGDAITVYYLDATNTPKSFTATTEESGASAVFVGLIEEGDTPDRFWASYPADRGSLTVVENTPVFSIQVKNSDGSFKQANVSAAYCEGDNKVLAFKNAGAIFKLTLLTDGAISKPDGTKHPIKTIRIKGKEASINSVGLAPVTVSGGAVTGFGDATNVSGNVTVTLSDEVRSSGIAWIPTLPGTFDHGFYIQYTPTDGIDVPAVVSKDVAVPVERGHIIPISDVSNRIGWELYVSSDGTGDGIEEIDPMSFTDFLEDMGKLGGASGTAYMYMAAKYNGVTVHLKGETFKVGENGVPADAPLLSFPKNSTTNCKVTFQGGWGGGTTILDGGHTYVAGCTEDTNTDGKGIIDIVGLNFDFTFKDMTLQHGYATNGAALRFAVGKTATDANARVNFVNCNFFENCSTAHGAVILAGNSNAAGIITLHNCHIEGNQVNGTASDKRTTGFYYSNGAGTALMINKCTFYANNTVYGCNVIWQNNAKGRLGINNCTIGRGSQASTNGTFITAKGKTVIVNSTLWGTNYIGKWGMIALGHPVAQNDTSSCLTLNCVLKNGTKTYAYPAFYFHPDYFQKARYCIYTKYDTADETVEEGTNYDVDATNLNIGCVADGTGTDLTGKAPNRPIIDGVEQIYYSWTRDLEAEGYTCPTLAQVRSLIAGVGGKGSQNDWGKMYLDWLDEVDPTALTTDISGATRSADRIYPGSWQKN